MSKNLLIVESPAKAKTIEKILGKDFTVKSSYGHVRDLDKGNEAVDVDDNFKPKYVVTPDKQKVVKELRSLSRKAEEVWLATDEDREGEAISWHLCEVLGLDPTQTKRIVFREITAPAILQAIKQPRTVDINLVNAQQARRILDRLVGFELSGTLWKKVRGKLSAGRVQSVAVKLVVEREREIRDFAPEPYFRLTAEFTVADDTGRNAILKAEYPSRFAQVGDAEAFLKYAQGATFTITSIEKKPLKRRPAPPFTTSTLQQEASRKLGFAVKRTMMAAQKLYEAGMITYMRTDSVNLSDVALGMIGNVIEKEYGKEYLKIRKYKTKKKDAQEAHEAIRPTDPSRVVVPSSDRDQQRLYDLIRKRALASQMADAQLEKTTVTIDIDGSGARPDDPRLTATGEVVKFEGFLKVYLESNDDDDDEDAAESGILPPLTKGQQLDLREMQARERFTRPPARFTEAGLVKKLEELGIGRPSTYAPTISKIMEVGRGYVIKGNTEGDEREYRLLTLDGDTLKKETLTEMAGAIRNRLVPTDMGMIVCDFLDKHFDDIMDYGFTADLEEEFDRIADGKADWSDVLESFYKPFHATVNDTIQHAERATGERILGIDPVSGRTLLVRMSRNGAVVQIGAPDELPEGEKPRYGNLRPGQSIETLTFEEALDLFKLPKTLGQYEGEDVVIGVGRYGPYVRHNDQFISLGRGADPLEVEYDQAVELIKEKQEADRPVMQYQGKPVQKGKGRFGPFLKWNDMFINIPKRYDAATISQADMTELIEKKIEKEANRYIQRYPDLGLDVENGRWGPFIRFKKKSVKIPKKDDGTRVTSEEAKAMTLDEIKALVEAEIPGAFGKKKAATKKKTAAKKKPAAKKTTAKKKAPAKKK